jgi:enoyl-CoA hydratase
MEYKNIQISTDSGFVWLTINRPHVRNALDAATWKEIHNFVDEAGRDKTIPGVIITGAGDEAFAAGSDFDYLYNRSALETLDGFSQHVLQELEELPIPTIAAVNGYALGGGCELAMACDLRIASERARFGQPEVGLGILPGAGGTQRLTMLVGLAKAKELIFTGDIIDAETAHQIGLVNQVVPPDQLVENTNRMAEKILKKGPLAVRLAKQSILAGMHYGHAAGFEIERMAQSVLFSTGDHLEGILAAKEKRRPSFRGE